MRGLLVDFGGVLTTSVTRSFRAFCGELGLERDLVKEVFLEAYDHPEGDGPVHQLETGRIQAAQFGTALAAALSARSGITVSGDGLIARLFALIELDERMLVGVARSRAAGVRTGLVSNSWGEEGYPLHRFDELFDTVVLSGEVGLRKPDPAIYHLAADRLGLPPSACVFVDDLDINAAAAEAIGMAGLVHRDAADTLPRLAALLGLDTDSLDTDSLAP